MVSRWSKEVHNHHFRVTIFGSARMKKTRSQYKIVETLARMIGAEGIDLVTGGGPGLMEAASIGHHEGRKDESVHSIGLRIKLPFEEGTSSGLDVKKEFAQFSKRLETFVYLSHVVVIAPGGVGTLLEFFYTWQLIQVGKVCKIPIIFMAPMWKGLIRWLKTWPVHEHLIAAEDLEYIHFVHSPEQAMHIIREEYAEYKKGKTCEIILPKHFVKKKAELRKLKIF